MFLGCTIEMAEIKEKQNEFTKGDALILESKKFGFVRAWANEDYSRYAGDLAYFEVNVNSANMPGITQMRINTNHFEIYKDDDPVVLKRILDAHVPYWITR